MSEIKEIILSYVPDIATKLPLLVAILVGAIIVHKLLCKASRHLVARTSLEMADVLPTRKVAATVVYFLAVILALTVLEVNLGGLWTILSTILAMVAIGFVAVWSLLSHISSALLILFFRPFVVGDRVNFPDEPVSGEVVDINYLYTTLRAEDGSLFQVPNNQFFQKTIQRVPRKPNAGKMPV
jgi:small-conductance mechanosensitive channel